MTEIPDYEKAARRAAIRKGIDPDIFVAQLRQESGLKPGLTSSAGAQGIAQFIPGTAKQYGVNLHDGRVRDDLDGAAQYMADNLKRTNGDYKAALSIYNSGRPDAYKDPGFADGQTYNYVKTILGNAGKPAKQPKLKKDAQPDSSSQTQTQTTTETTPGVDNSGQRLVLGQQFLSSGGVFNPAATRDFAIQYAAAADVPGATTTTYAQAPQQQGPAASSKQPRLKSGLIPLGGSKNAGKGAFTVDGPDPKRLKPQLRSFAEEVAEVYGGTLEGKDGSSHSKYTVNGNVSQHHTGKATDIFKINGKPATGKRLIRAGRAALIAAGMPREQALKAPGGLYNVGGHQIIFGVDGVENGGNHMDHLHISAR